jgi:hypothetical protein
MKPQDLKKHREPANKPRGSSSTPKLPGEESEDIIKGAKQEDQLEKLQPKRDEERASNAIGSPPVKQAGKNDKDA